MTREGSSGRFSDERRLNVPSAGRLESDSALSQLARLPADDPRASRTDRSYLASRDDGSYRRAREERLPSSRSRSARLDDPSRRVRERVRLRND
ncbi:hypothetical protein [Caudoviricetes sp.]|nr:hypothetical protein [Caudoviricetes sp.]